MDKHLFLFGGSPPFTPKMAQQFVKKSIKKHAPISILVLERDGWQAYMPKYTTLLEQAGLRNFQYLPLPSTTVETAVQCINNSAGIIIGGGDTNLYADYIVDTVISPAIKERYELGVPVAGFSAGALISPDTCIISPKDNVQNEFQQREGLGLISNTLLAVHFSQWQDESHLRKAVNLFNDHNNYGLDEQTGIYLRNGQVEATEGEGVFYVENDVVKAFTVY